MVRLALVIPCYNSAATIGETLESVQQQDSLDCLQMVMIADDASADETLKVAEAAWRTKLPLTVLRQPRNLGERGNVNSAIRQLPPEIDWVLILHADDLAKPHWVREMATTIEVASQPVATVCSSWDTLIVDGSLQPGEDNPARPVEYISGGGGAVSSTLRNGCWWHISGSAIQRRTFDDIGGFSEKLPQLGDWEWLLRCLERGRDVLYIPRTLIVYRLHAASISSQSFRTHRDIEEWFEIVPTRREFLSKHEYLGLHFQKLGILARRFAASVGRWQWDRAGKALSLGVRVLGSAGRAWVDSHQ